MVDISLLSNKLIYKNGIWYSKNKTSISYPEDGHDLYFDIEKDSFWFNHRNNCLFKSMRGNSKNGIFLDIGGGNGYVTNFLQDNSIDAILVEPGENGANNAKKRNVKSVICSTIEECEFNEKSIDNIGLFDVIEHIENDKDFLKSLNNILTDNGLIYITVPAFKFLWSNEDVFAGHYRRYNLKDICKIVEDSGYKIEYSTYIFSFLVIPLLFFKSIPSKMGFLKTKKTQSVKNEHNTQNNLVNKTINSFLKWELRKIENRKKIPFGSSCFIIAKKI